MSPLVWQVGAVRITRVQEQEIPMRLAALLPEATPDAVRPYREWLAPHFVDENDRCRVSVHALLVETPDRKILIDTCVGERRVAGFDLFQPGDSSFLRQLEAAGAPRNGIDIVLCTHLHFDHVGWNTMREGDRWVPTFPESRTLIARTEWEHWRAARDTTFASTLAETIEPLLAADLVDWVETDHRICDEVRLEPAPGHTPGHVAVRIESEGQRALVTGDLTHHPVQWAEPDWKMPADEDAAEAAATRRRLRHEYADSDLLVIGTHYPAPTAGRITTRAGGFRFET